MTHKKKHSKNGISDIHGPKQDYSTLLTVKMSRNAMQSKHRVQREGGNSWYWTHRGFGQNGRYDKEYLILTDLDAAWAAAGAAWLLLDSVFVGRALLNPPVHQLSWWRVTTMLVNIPIPSRTRPQISLLVIHGLHQSALRPQKLR